MLKNNSLIIILLFFATFSGQKISAETSSNNEIIASFMQLSQRQLFDTANYFFEKNSIDTALICYTYIINTPAKEVDFEQQKRIVESLNRTGIIYYFMCDYRSAYDYFIKALLLCEKINYDAYKSKIYPNIGNIHFLFKKNDIAKSYYTKALSLCRDSATIVLILNNLGVSEIERGKMDSAAYFLFKSLNISDIQGGVHKYYILGNIALLYKKAKQYDSAYYYYQLSLIDSKKHNKAHVEADNYMNLGILFFEINNQDSARHYIRLANSIARENNFLGILAENYKTLSKLEEAKGNTIKAFEHYKEYTNLKDSVYNTEKFGEINQLQRLYEVSITNQTIEQLIMEQQIKERTIKYQKIIQRIIISVLVLVVSLLFFILFQYKKIKNSYKILFNKNIEIIKLQEIAPEPPSKPIIEPITEPILEPIITETTPPPETAQTIETTETTETAQTIETPETPQTIETQNKPETSNLKPETPTPKQTIKTAETPETIETKKTKKQKKILSENELKELLEKILSIMENINVICDVDFNIIKLSDLISSNQSYVSQTINRTYGENFRWLLNSYRVKIAQKIINDPNTKLYTLENLSKKVGFKARSTFIAAFKEFTGLSPHYYLKNNSSQ